MTCWQQEVSLKPDLLEADFLHPWQKRISFRNDENGDCSFDIDVDI